MSTKRKFSQQEYDKKRAEEVKTFTLRLKNDLHKELRLHCVMEDISVTDYLTQLIKKDLNYVD